MRYLKASMQKRRVTVHFGPVRVVVPCLDDNMTVGDLAHAAVTRYKRATGKVDCDVRVIRLELLSDEGILDSDDCLLDVFDELHDQVLAIYDEDPPSSSSMSSSRITSMNSVNSPVCSSPMTRSAYATSSPSQSRPGIPDKQGMSCSTSAESSMWSSAASQHYARSPLIGKVRNSVVEITSLDSPPSNGLRVSSHPESEAPIRSSLRSDASTPSKHRVTMSPEVEKRTIERSELNDTRLTRSSARKSRISDSFFDAKDRLEDSKDSSLIRPPGSQRVPIVPSQEDANTSIVVFPDEDHTTMGIEVTAVPDDNAPAGSSRLSAVQIIRIEETGRVGRDGRLRVGDNIIAIDGRPVYQMSVLRARAYLTDQQHKNAPTLTVSRPVSSFSSKNEMTTSQCEDEVPRLSNRSEMATSSQKRMMSALQQANTRAIGQTTTVPLTKSSAGFGFTVTGRETTKGERLFYIGTVKPNGVALGNLKAGDRLLQINGEVTSELTQPEVVDRLKRAQVGETVVFLVSRVGSEENKENQAESNLSPSQASDTGPGTKQSTAKEELKGESEIEELEFVIPLNSTGSAGLGLSLKARVIVRSDRSRQDCGIFIKNVLHGGAAHKDGRLQLNDRIVGIEDIRLDESSNGAASDAVTKMLKTIGPTSDHVKLIIQRRRPASDSHLLIAAENEPHLGGSLQTPSPASVRAGTSSDFDQRSSVNSESTRLDESELADVDPFNREAPARKSMSEKRGMGAALDPNHIKLFQDIKHHRHTSAPPSTPGGNSSSFHGKSARSASQRAAARVRSQSVHPRAPAPPPTAQPSSSSHPTSIVESAKRRSLSVESIHKANEAEYAELFQNKEKKKVGRGTPVSHSFRQAVGMDDPNYGTVPHPYPPGSPLKVEPRGDVNRDKHRRKSMGSAVKSWLGMKADDGLPEGNRDYFERNELNKREEEDKRRVQAHYERLRQREMEANQRVAPTPNFIRREMPHRIYGEFEPPAYTTQLPSPDQPLILSNSRFYASQRASTCDPQPASKTTTFTVDTRPTAIQPVQNTPRRTITTLFPVQNRMEAQCIEEGARMRAGARERSLPDKSRITTTCLTRGSPTVAEAHPTPRPSSTQQQAVADHRLDGTVRKWAEPGCPPRQHNTTPPRPNQPNSTPIAFPTTRFAFAGKTTVRSSGNERLSLRARKKHRRSVQSMIESSPSELEATSRHSPSVATAKMDSKVVSPVGEEYCSVWNEWKSHSGSSLPARRPRLVRTKVGPALYETVTDC